MIANIPSATLLGVDGHAVSVEVHVAPGIPSFALVGLPDAACRESKDRVRAAILSSGLTWPQKRVTVNLAPSGLRKIGAGLDLAIAVGCLVAAEQLTLADVENIAFVGELGLDGSLRPVTGVIPLVDSIGDHAVVVPCESVHQARLIARREVRGAASLQELVAALKGEGPWGYVPALDTDATTAVEPDIRDVRGQPLARWALEVAAAGGHNVLMTGPPGSGKTMLARRLPGLLPDLDAPTALTATKVHSAAGTLLPQHGLMRRPPFRAPHHTSSSVSIIGGGAAAMRPGEISLSHGGVLFLDEMGEFPRNVLDTLRQPLEEGVVRISRAQGTAVYPASFLVVGAMNPCPCGEGVSPGSCRCSDAMLQRYAAKLSGPLLDRFDLRVIVQRPRVEQFFDSKMSESSTEVAQRVAEARDRSVMRGVRCNAVLTPTQLEEFAPLSRAAELLVQSRMRNNTLTARGMQRVRRVALTLADLDGSAVLQDHHVSAALELRPDITPMDRAS